MVFMGSDVIALPTLEYLWGRKDEVELSAIYTQPDRARGRGKKVQPNAIKIWASEKAIPVLQPEKFDPDSIQELADLKADVILVMAYGHLLPQAVLDLPPLGIYNLHTSLLPELRGASPIETAVASGFKESGVSLMQLVMRMDAGPVCDQEPVPVLPVDTGGSYREKLAAASPLPLERQLKRILDGSISPEPQHETNVTYCRLLVKQDGQLDFSQPAKSLAHRINGLFPWPGCSAELDGVMLKFGLADFEDTEETLEPGVVLESSADAIRVATGKGVLRLLRLQRPGGKMLEVDAFLLGFPIPVGARFQSREMHPLVSTKPVSHKRVFQLYAKP